MSAPAVPVLEAWVPANASDRQWAHLSSEAPQLTATMRRYLGQLTTFLAPRSVDAADATLRQFARWLTTATDVGAVTEITRTHIEDYKVWLAAQPGTKAPTLAKSTQRQRLRMIRIFLERLIEWDWPDAPGRNPILVARRPCQVGSAPAACFPTWRGSVPRERLFDILHGPCVSFRAHEMRFLTPDEVVSLADAIGSHYRPLILTAAYVGLRWGELAGLALENVDLLRGTIRVERQLQDVSGRLEFGPPKTKAGIRTVTLPKTLAGALGRHFAGEAVKTSGLAFPTVTGKPMRPTNFRKVWRRACTDAGFDDGPLDGLVFHELRHTAASLATAQGAHPLAIKERLGHSSITTRLDRYGHLFPALDDAIAEGLDEVLADSLAAAAGPGAASARPGPDVVIDLRRSAGL